MDGSAMAAKPAHVPDALVFDLDIYKLPGLDANGTTDDVHALWKREVQDKAPPVFWTPRHGGMWVASRYDAIREMLMQPTALSSKDSFVPRGNAPLLIPVAIDPPDHLKYRKLLMPIFSPQMLNRAETAARAAAIEIIEQLKPKGRCEFISQFGSVMPIVTFLTLINLPLEDREYLRELSHRQMPQHPEAVEAWAESERYVARQVELRRAQPQDDFLTSLLTAKVDGRLLTMEEVLGIAKLVVTGGLDTVVLMTSFTANYLAQHPEQQRELREHPERIDTAIEEFLRRFGTSNLGRIAVEDTTLGGQQIKTGDFVFGLFPLAGLDEAMNDDPLTIDFSRAKPQHLVFGIGPHTCIGNRLAKREIRIFLEEWLTRIPNYRLAEGFKAPTTPGMINHIHELQLEWDPA